MRVNEKVRYFCDNCNKEVGEGGLSLSKISDRIGLIELCADCQKEFVEYVNNFFAKEKAKNNEKEIQDDQQEVKVGDIIKFGKYPQSKDGEEAPIEWQVIDIKDGDALLISRYVLDCKPFDEDCQTNDWEDCSLREWLNSEFRREAFTPEEYVKRMRGGVFLLSEKEADWYFDLEEARICAPTEYAKIRGVWTNDACLLDGKPTCDWWLRSHGYNRNYASFITNRGIIDNFGKSAGCDYTGVRPAIWINL